MAIKVKEKPKVSFSAVESGKGKMLPEEFHELDGRVFSEGIIYNGYGSFGCLGLVLGRGGWLAGGGFWVF